MSNSGDSLELQQRKTAPMTLTSDYGAHRACIKGPVTSGPKGLVPVCYSTRVVRGVKNVCAYNPRSCFIIPDESFGVFSRV